MRDEDLFHRMRRSSTVSLIAACVALMVSLMNLRYRATANESECSRE